MAAPRGNMRRRWWPQGLACRPQDSTLGWCVRMPLCVCVCLCLCTAHVQMHRKSGQQGKEPVRMAGLWLLFFSSENVLNEKT